MRELDRNADAARIAATSRKGSFFQSSDNKRVRRIPILFSQGKFTVEFRIAQQFASNLAPQLGPKRSKKPGKISDQQSVSTHHEPTQSNEYRGFVKLAENSKNRMTETIFENTPRLDTYKRQTC